MNCFLGVPAKPSGFPLYLFPLRSKRMPLQSLTQSELKTENLNLKINFPFSTFNFQFKKLQTPNSKKSPRESYRIEKKQQKSDSFSRADEKRFCIGSAECYVTIINKTDAKVISSDTDDWMKTSFRQI